MQIEIRNLVRTFGATRAVDDISFRFGSGNIFGFIGPNGAGKTTTIKIMATLDQPESGDVFYDGVSVVSDPDKVRRLIGYMPDSLPEYRDIEVWEYLDFFARAFGLKGAARKKVLAEIEEFTNLGEIRRKYLAALSKGMKQRVSLARALVHNPPVLLMDEPAAGLDPRARLELRALLKILAQQGKAILLSSHILSELQDICDGAVIIEKGRLLSAGTLDELLHDAQTRTGAAPCEGASGASPAQPSGTTVILELLEDAEKARLKLLEHPAVSQARLDENGRRIEAVIAGSDRDISRVVGTLFAADLPVIGFRKQELGLEELFMKITTGGVQ